MRAVCAALVVAGCAVGGPAQAPAPIGHEAASPVAVDHDPLDDFLATYVVLGADGVARIPYDAVAEGDRRALDFYVARQRRVRVDALSRAEQLAFWVNLHNALALKLILDSWPVERFSQVVPQGGGDPRTTPVALQFGRLFSLADLRAQALADGDARLHYALFDGTLGGPNIGVRAFRGDELDAQLTDAARAFINHPRGAEAQPDGAVRINPLFFRHRADFGRGDDLRRSLARHAEPELAQALRAGAPLRRAKADDRINGLTPGSP